MRILDILFGGESDEPGGYRDRVGQDQNDMVFGGDQEKQDRFREAFGGADRQPRSRGRVDTDMWEYPDSKEGDGPQVRFKEAAWGGIPMRGANGERVGVRVQKRENPGEPWRDVRDPEQAYSLFRQLRKNSSSGSNQERRPRDRDGDGLYDYNRR